MACTVIYPNPLKPKPGRPPWHLVKGQLDGKPCRWHVTIWYRIPDAALEADEVNPRRVTFKVAKPAWLQDMVREVIDAHLQGEVAACGGVSDIRWSATQER
uniref:Uncharacterized protein n=1 Tax=viral metagenome TaxID=1070528 RepID=A0A6M3M830_9ZZZZ